MEDYEIVYFKTVGCDFNFAHVLGARFGNLLRPNVVCGDGDLIFSRAIELLDRKV